jgi:hypothetical protein
LGSFLLPFCRLYFLYLWLAPLLLLWCPWFMGLFLSLLLLLEWQSVLAYSFHSSAVYSLNNLLLFL